MTPEQQAFWDRFRCETGRRDAALYEAFAFGDSPRMADILLDEIRLRRKRATCGPLRDGQAPPRPGDLSLALDGAGRPALVIETTEVEIKPLIAVDDSFAWDEGEGLRTRSQWLRFHRNFFMRDAAVRGAFWSDDLPAVFERFRVVWPPRFAD